MRTLYLGLTGDDVIAWQHFLLGTNPHNNIIADGTFSQDTKDATKQFQSSVGFLGEDVDGVVGPATFGKAFSLGFNPLIDDRIDKNGPNWPPRPGPNLNFQDRVKLFGQFSYVAAPIPNNPEAIKIIDNWPANNIISVQVPQLSKFNVIGRPTGDKVICHKLIAPQLVSLFNAWEADGLMPLVLTFGGSWVPRFIRGSRTSLSNHAWGTAFDINVQWNMLGAQPALKGQKGSTRELVLSAYEHGFSWGGHFQGRPDGMHFEVSRIIQ
jgi:hypothetical protein